MAAHNELGKHGENIAVQFLIDKGYNILEINWKYGRWEIDIIAQKYDFLSIIEVKTRSTNYFGFPESFVTKKKMQNLVNATDEYLKQKNLSEKGIRFEIVAITKTQKGFDIEHIEEAFNSTHAFGVSPFDNSY
ncbi:hypothetical protein HW49_01215 [Porphyromonadaceae bacterium COT-184 OH4590]|nr:hypothetical protein HW49_01215 [Porphyromonadaceae bacterium COT-184 OH4590]MDO4725795.1 YraN family protein [Porphyromonadaceae bacterium]